MSDEKERTSAVSPHVEELAIDCVHALEAEVARLTDEALAERCRHEVREAELERQVNYYRAGRRYLMNAMRAVSDDDSDYRGD